MSVRFDAQYYQRFYLDPETRVYDQARHAGLVAGVVHLIEWFGVELRSVLDVGAGLGWWGQWLAAQRPKVKVTSTELEPEVCRRYGHQQADITTFRLARQFDLVVCQGVLPYLARSALPAAVDNLAAMTGRFFYLEAITKEDLTESIDPERTDMRVKLYPAATYRRLLKPHFREIGAGLWAKKDANLPFYALEAR